RLCYAGTVLRTRPEGLLGTRTPLRIGAELYGVDGPSGDAEILALMVRTLQAAGVCDGDGQVQVELGHVAIYRSLAALAGLDAEAAGRLFDAVQRKAGSDIDLVLTETDCGAEAAELIRVLPSLYGDLGTLARAREALAGAPAAVGAALEELERIAELAERRAAGLELRFDLAELRGYNYHSGTVFTAYAADHGRIVAGGGRYDGVGGAFGRARPATGFDADLKVLAELGVEPPAARGTVLAPDDEGLDPERQRALWRRAEALRDEGLRVVASPSAACAEERLEWRDGDWVRVPLDGEPTGH
ncbi:MAG: ATP phosphoribosyltransferase regulatory subunit, partial [Pseudomonadales bacterium]|nr:ATP phosphoribosyltransferase regulatory subunit [Pseudomonadales bacterium]